MQQISEKEAYANKCDELSELEAIRESENGAKVFGRWFLGDQMLCTWVCAPKIGVHVFGKMFLYEISPEMLQNEANLNVWIECLSEKDWMGESGINSLRKAFKFLTKKRKSGIIKLENEE